MAEEKKNYYELLKHPKWQKKRLKIMEEADFECQNCGSKDDTLHVHHLYYEKDKAPWDYPEGALQCLCENCHKEAKKFQELLKEQLKELFQIDSFYSTEVLIGYLLAIQAEAIPHKVIEITSYEIAEGIADRFGLTPEQVIGALQERCIDGWALDELSKKHGKKAKREKQIKKN